MTIKDAKRGSRRTAVQEQGAGRDGRRFVRDARRAGTSRASGQFWYGIWRNFRAA